MEVASKLMPCNQQHSSSDSGCTGSSGSTSMDVSRWVGFIGPERDRGYDGRHDHNRSRVTACVTAHPNPLGSPARLYKSVRRLHPLSLSPDPPLKCDLVTH